MKLFNLEAALAGAPVVTRDGREVTQLKLFELKGREPLYGVIENNVYRWDSNGVFRPDGTETSYNLFMFEAKPEVWEPTMELRTVAQFERVIVEEYESGPVESKEVLVKNLQQKWICEGKEEWRNVPHVGQVVCP
jgi:hypothetical protein